MAIHEAISSRQAVSVTTSPTRLDTDRTNDIPVTLLIVAQASGTLILGGSTVTSSTGARLPVAAGDIVPFDFDGEGFYACVASGTLSVDVLIAER